jgi:tetratricopeptide (TPR) repeat protein
MMYGQRGLALSQRIHFLRGEARALHVLGGIYRILGDESKSLEMLYKGLQIAEDNYYPFELARCLNSISVLYYEFGDYTSAIRYLMQSQKIDETIHHSALGIIQLSNITRYYTQNKQLDSALNYAAKACDESKLLQSEGNPFPYPMEGIQHLLMNIGEIQFQLGNHPIAFAYMQKSQAKDKSKNNYHRALTSTYYSIANFLKRRIRRTLVFTSAKKGLDEAFK